jgi:hypothetical protein
MQVYEFSGSYQIFIYRTSLVKFALFTEMRREKRILIPIPVVYGLIDHCVAQNKIGLFY